MQVRDELVLEGRAVLALETDLVVVDQTESVCHGLEDAPVGTLEVVVEVLPVKAEDVVGDLLHGDGHGVLARDGDGDVVERLNRRDAQVLAPEHVVDVTGTLGRDGAQEVRVVLGLVKQGVDLRLGH